MTAVFLLQLAAALFMTGLIWFVQLVHYPLFAFVERGAFVRYQQEHVRRTTWVVGPPMLLEAATAAALILAPFPALGLSGAAWNAVGLALIWLSTWRGQVPQHDRLLSGFSEGPHRKLVRGNWLRTALWTARSAGLLWVAASLLE